MSTKTSTHKVGYFVEGAITFRRPLEVPDERVIELVRKLDAILDTFDAPSRGRKKPAESSSGIEPDTKATAVSPDETA